MINWRNLLPRKLIPYSLALIILAIGGSQSTFNQLAFTNSAHATRPAPSAQSAQQDDSEGRDVVYLNFSLRTILNMTPKKLGLLAWKTHTGSNAIVVIEGFSANFSSALLISLAGDVEFTKKLLRDMRDARSAKQRAKVLERHQKRLQEERNKLKKQIRDTFKEADRRDDKRPGGRPFIRDYIYMDLAQKRTELLGQLHQVTKNLALIKKWQRDLSEGP